MLGGRLVFLAIPVCIVQSVQGQRRSVYHPAFPFLFVLVLGVYESRQLTGLTADFLESVAVPRLIAFVE